MADERINVVGTNIAEKATMIWNVADMLRGPFKPYEYGLVILPMSTMKRFITRITIVITVCLFAIIMPLAVFAENQSSDYETIASGTCYNCIWRVDQNDNETILVISGNGTENEYIVPDYAGSDTKSKPGYQYKDQITKIIVGEDITYIGNYSFSDFTVVEKVVLPRELSIIKSSVFQGCIKLNEVNLPDNLKEIGNHAFHGCSSLSDITFPDSLTFIGTGAFYGCVGLKEVYIPDGVTGLGSTFVNCTELESVRLPNNIKSIGYNVFENCSKLSNVRIPDSVNRICGEAFKNCSSLEEIEIPESVTTIEYDVFRGAKIKKLIIPSTIPNYSSDSPYKNAWIEHLVLKGGYTQVANKILCEAIVTDLTFSDTTEIGNMSLSSSTSSNQLSSIIIPEEVKSIGSITVTGVPNFKSISFPDDLEYIKSISLIDCPNVYQFVIPNCMTTIGTYTFNNCSHLYNVTIPSSVKTIQNNAFSGTNLQSINYLGSEKQWSLIEKSDTGIPDNVYVNYNAIDLCFDLNGGLGDAPFIAVPRNTECIIPDYSLKAPRGKHFVYWTKYKDSYGDPYYPGDTITINTNTLLYALWEDHYYDDWKTTKAATEISAGQKSHKCSACGKTETKKIAQLKPTLPAVTITKPKAAKKAATVKWKKVSTKNRKKIQKIQIQYSTDKTFKKGVKTVYAKKSATSKKITKLTSKKTYYVRIRAYKKDTKGVHVSKWSAVKSVKAK